MNATEIFEIVGFENTNEKDLCLTTCGGLAITLHNEGMRPTVYHVEIKPNGCFYDYVIDTIIRSKPEHESLKMRFNSANGNALKVAATIARLLAQDCDGTKKGTLGKYIPIGLLYCNKDGTVT